jgi:hypothetical protein
MTTNLPQPYFSAAGREDAPRLLIISYHFPPSQEVGALRWQKLARYAAERGWGLDIITLHVDDLARSDPSRLRELPPGTRVYLVRRPQLRLERWWEGAWRAWQSLASAMRRAGSSPAGPPAPRAESRSRREMTWWPVRARDLKRAYFAWLEYARDGRWARDAARLALTGVITQSHRAVITSGPPHSSHIAGRRITQATGMPFIMELRDPWHLVQRLPEHFASPVWLALAGQLERKAVADASLIVTTTDPLRNAMQGAYPAAAARMIAVPNGFDDEPLPVGTPGVRFVVAYAGSIYLDRDPRVLFRAAARVVRQLSLSPDDFGIELMGQVKTFNGHSVADVAQEEGVGRFVRLRPPGTRAEALRFLSDAALLVVLPQDSDMAIPAKVFDYMRFDAWLLALAEPRSAVDLLLRDSGADVVPPDDVDGIAGILAAHYGQFRQRERGTRLSTNPKYARATQAATLLDAIERVCGGPQAEKPVPQVNHGRGAALPRRSRMNG